MTLTASLPEEYGIHSQGDLNCAVFHVDTGLFPLNQKFRFAFPETLIGEKKKEEDNLKDKEDNLASYIQVFENF